MSDTILYVVWYKHARRAETLSRELGAKLVFIYETPWLKPLRYVVQAWRTWRLLNEERPGLYHRAVPASIRAAGSGPLVQVAREETRLVYPGLPSRYLLHSAAALGPPANAPARTRRSGLSAA